MNSKMLEHLRGRKIAPILNTSIGSNTTALKMLCILDYEMEKANLYTEILAMPKLLGQLLSFHSFTQFHYFKYNLPMETDGKVLKCKYCELIGPYLIVLEHMVINHNFHANARLCMWCDKLELETHNVSHTLDQCYGNYLFKSKFATIHYPTVIVKFYDLLRKVAQKLRVRTIRQKSFRNAMDSSSSEMIPHTDDTIDRNIVVYRPKMCNRTFKNVNDDAMEILYKNAMKNIYKERAVEYIGVNSININPMTADFNTSTSSQSSTARKQVNAGNDSINSTMFQTLGEIDSSLQFDMPSSSASQYTPTASSTFAEIPPWPQFGMPTQESTFAHFITSVLDNIQDEHLKKRAKLEIKQVIFKYSAEDTSKQMTKDGQDSDSDDS